MAAFVPARSWIRHLLWLLPYDHVATLSL
jgi:hypothetical protein